jgi:hypothetical protein
MLRSQGIERFGWVKGVGAASPAEPHHMDEGSPFFTDGLRVVLWFGKPPIAFDEIRVPLGQAAAALTTSFFANVRATENNATTEERDAPFASSSSTR